MLRTIIREYTREAGVRNLERQHRRRSAARRATQVAKGKTQTITRRRRRRLREWLGPRRFRARCASARPSRASRPGSPYTAVGGDVLFIEATAYPGKGSLDVTGQLGDVMQESAQAALSWMRSHAGRARRRPRTGSTKHDIHIHVPAGAVPKDGPSAGITMATAIASLLRGEPVAERRRHDRRDHAHRPGAPDRRRPGEGARRAARRPEAGDPAARKRARSRRPAARDARRNSRSSSSTRSRMCWRTPSPAMRLPPAAATASREQQAAAPVR